MTDLTDTFLEEVQTLELLVKDVKSTVLNMFSKQRETVNKELKEIRAAVHDGIKHISKEIEIIKWN